MNVVFYTCDCDNRVVDKSSHLTQGTTYNCSVYQQTGVMHPSLLLTYSSAIVNYNYFKIEDWHRWYYITGIEVMPGGRCVVTGSEDVLYSNKDEIKTLSAYVIRTESANPNSLIVDNKIPCQANRHCKTLKFSTSPFGAEETSPVYLLTVLGGVSR